MEGVFWKVSCWGLGVRFVDCNVWIGMGVRLFMTGLSWRWADYVADAFDILCCFVMIYIYIVETWCHYTPGR